MYPDVNSEKSLTMQYSSQNPGSPLFKMLLSMVIFGTIGIFRRSIPLPSEVLAFARGILGGLFLLLILKGKRQAFSWRLIRKKSFALLVLSGAMIGFNWILLFEAYKYTTVAVATLCYYMQPVIVLLFARPLLHEKITRRQYLCVGLALIGMVLVSGILQGDGSASGNGAGILLGLGAAVLYAGVVLLNKTLTRVPAYEKTTIQLFSAAIALIPYMGWQGSLRSFNLSPSSIVLLLIVGVVHTGIAYVLYFGALEALPARTAALLSYIDPVTAVLLSAVWLHEPLSISGIIGAILIIGSAIYSES